MDLSSTHNESKTTEMSSNVVNYNELEMMSEEIDQERVDAFKTEVKIDQEWKFKGQLTTHEDKDDRTQYQINSNRNRLSYIKNYGSLIVRKFDEEKIGDQCLKIDLANPAYKGIASYCWNPTKEGERAGLMSLAMFGGAVEHWQSTTRLKMGVYIEEDGEMFTDIAYSPDGKTVAVGCRSGNVYLLDVDSGSKTKLTVEAKHGNRVQVIHWDQQGLYTLGWDDVLMRWDLMQPLPTLECFCPCPNKEAAHFFDDSVLLGLVQRKNNLQIIDFKKGGPSVIKTIQSEQAGLHLTNQDRSCEIQMLKQTNFDPSLFAVTTSHNKCFKLIRINGSLVSEVCSYEDLPDGVLTLESSSTFKRLFLAGSKYQSVLDFI